jgi:hypothetical protein
MNSRLILGQGGHQSEYSFTVRLFTGRSIDKVDLKYDEKRSLKSFIDLEEHLVSKNLITLEGSMTNLSTQIDHKFLGRHDKQFLSMIKSLGNFLNEVVESDSCLRDTLVLDFLNVPIYKRDRLSELLP